MLLLPAARSVFSLAVAFIESIVSQASLSWHLCINYLTLGAVVQAETLLLFRSCCIDTTLPSAAVAASSLIRGSGIHRSFSTTLSLYHICLRCLCSSFLQWRWERSRKANERASRPASQSASQPATTCHLDMRGNGAVWTRLAIQHVCLSVCPFCQSHYFRVDELGDQLICSSSALRWRQQ